MIVLIHQLLLGSAEMGPQLSFCRLGLGDPVLKCCVRVQPMISQSVCRRVDQAVHLATQFGGSRSRFLRLPQVPLSHVSPRLWVGDVLVNHFHPDHHVDGPALVVDAVAELVDAYRPVLVIDISDQLVPTVPVHPQLLVHLENSQLLKHLIDI